jgi:hypothetical protein
VTREPSPAEIARYTVEENGGKFVATVSEVFDLFGYSEIDAARRGAIRRALRDEGVTTKPDLRWAAPSRKVELSLTRWRVPGPIAAVPWQRARPQSWKGWTVIGVGFLLLVAVLGGGSDDSNKASESQPAATQSSPASPTRAELAELRRERAELRRERRRLARQREAAQERARERRRRAQERRRERARQRAAAAEARAESERQEEAQALQAAPAPQAENCHPSYDPCLDPSVSDYDCDGGSGDGPGYTGTVTVTGNDEYGLDSDGDGVGCDS